MDELKKKLLSCCGGMSIDEIESAILGSNAATAVDDPRIFAAYLKKNAS